jgi:hypothetical protein
MMLVECSSPEDVAAAIRYELEQRCGQVFEEWELKDWWVDDHNSTLVLSICSSYVPYRGWFAGWGALLSDSNLPVLMSTGYGDFKTYTATVRLPLQHVPELATRVEKARRTVRTLAEHLRTEPTYRDLVDEVEQKIQLRDRIRQLVIDQFERDHQEEVLDARKLNMYKP